MNLKTRLSKLEETTRQKITEVECICFPPEEPPRFSNLAPSIYRAIRGPHKKVSSSEIHDFTPKAESPRWRSIARETSASVPVFSTVERSGNCTH